MRALATTQEIPLFVPPLDGNSSENVSLLAAIPAIQEPWRVTDEAARVSVADHVVSSEATRRVFNQAHVQWISRVSETSTHAKAALAQSDETWHASADGTTHGVSQIMSFPPSGRSNAGLWASADVCDMDAQTAMEREKKGQPAWRDTHHDLEAHARHASRGRPRKEDSLFTEKWHIVVTVTINHERVEQEAFRKAWWMAGTNILETAELSDHALTTTDKEQGGVERSLPDTFSRIKNVK